MAKPKSKKNNKITPFFGSGVLADSSRRGDGRKIDVLGVFTIIYAWSIPCTRSFNAVLTIFNLPKGKTSITISISKKGSQKLRPLGLLNVFPEESGDIIVLYAVKNKFEEEGFHEVTFSFRDYPGDIKLPLEVEKREWPEFTKAELDFVKQLGDASPSFRVNIHCLGCKHVYIFEEQLNPDILLKGGIYRFPENSIFICKECKKEMDLKDIRGQLRSSLKDTIAQRMGKKP
ncbi:hypothetical protein LCGC14_0885120 [marine sediment metagenome]|uniref:Uncharacterized protein n=1 Tax=marine sediment metagenome TaxID=412755 RepID=A0A0F9PLF2_9ZZZZ|nr:hypothetical protein [Candidatus Aminicenantes bacterium]